MRPVEDDADREMLAQSIRRLTPREQQIITMRFGLGGRDELTQKEVADIMGISQSYISRLEKRRRVKSPLAVSGQVSRSSAACKNPISV